MNNTDLKQEVKEANKLLYDSIWDNYEKIDGRRSERLFSYVRNDLQNISVRFKENTKLLDIACGSGFIMKAAKGLFNKIYGMDISLNILRKALLSANGVICADVDFIPLKEKSINVVVLFSAMHHFYDYNEIINEIYRILKPRGILYINHDINNAFIRRFRIFIWLYRKTCGGKRKYMNAGIKEKIYDLSEFHSDGVDADNLINYLEKNGFDICDNIYHWYGLSKLTDFVFRHKKFNKSYAPLMKILARKK